MKNKICVVLLGAIVCGALLMSGCAVNTAGMYSTHEGAFGELVRTPSKDFESRGLVFSEVEYQHSTRGARESFNGQTFIYQELLREAQRLGADAIINVFIDRRITDETSGTRILSWILSPQSTRKTTWYGTALAIKYTDTLVTTNPTVQVTDHATITSGGTGYYMNDRSRDLPARSGSIFSSNQAADIPGGERQGLFSRIMGMFGK